VVSVGHRNDDVVGDRLEVVMGSRRGRSSWWLTPSVRVEIERRLVAGERVVVIAAAFGCSTTTIKRVRSDLWLRRRVSDSGFRLGFEDRVGIEVGIARGESDAVIARGLGRHRSSIGREIGRCQSRSHYRAVVAQRKADRLARRPKLTRLAGSPGLLAEVEAGLRERWSPQQISARLRRRFPGDWSMQISHETIYQSLFVQSRGELRRELTAYLRSGRTSRRRQGSEVFLSQSHRSGSELVHIGGAPAVGFGLLDSMVCDPCPAGLA
jgi:IS30 family transposase